MASGIELYLLASQALAPWTAVTYAGSWSGLSGEDLLYRVYGDRTLGLSGRLMIPSSPGDPSTICTLPSTCWPQRVETVYAVENPGSPYTAIAHYAQLSTSGVLAVYGTLTAGNTLNISARIPLDTLSI